MAVPTWSVGQVLAASDVNLWFVPIVIQKGANQSVTSSTTLVNDTALVLAVAANAIYALDGFFIYDGDAAGDIKWHFTAPASATLNWVSSGLASGAAGSTDNVSRTAQTLADTAPSGAIGAGSSVVLPVLGILTTAGTAGNLQLQWSQNASSAV